MKRIVEPEWLDELPSEDPRALASRRDIRRLNRLMGHTKTLHDLLHSATQQQSPRRIVELGAGDGTFMLGLAKSFSKKWHNMEIILVDCKDAVTDETRHGFASLGCYLETITADVGDWLKKPDKPADVMIANLFLHQFSAEQLSKWFMLTSRRTNIFAACEPRRSAGPFALSRMVGLIGCNDVTRHDAPASVRAGFSGREISELWPSQDCWRLQERSANFFSHTFLAQLATPI